jgi:hypothetical protein
MNRQLIYKQQEDEDKRRGYTGYWAGGRYYSPTNRPPIDTVHRGSTSTAKTGFFSRMMSSFRSSG